MIETMWVLILLNTQYCKKAPPPPFSAPTMESVLQGKFSVQATEQTNCYSIKIKVAGFKSKEDCEDASKNQPFNGGSHACEKEKK